MNVAFFFSYLQQLSNMWPYVENIGAQMESRLSPIFSYFALSFILSVSEPTSDTAMHYAIPVTYCGSHLAWSFTEKGTQQPAQVIIMRH